MRFTAGLLTGLILAIVPVALAQGINFSDVIPASWYESAVMRLSEKGILQGYPDGSFQPEKTVNRAELAVTLDRLPQTLDGNVVGVNEKRVQIYLVKLEDNGKLGRPTGCADEDSLVAVPRNVPSTSAILKTALEELFAFKDISFNGSGYYSAVSDLQLEKVSVEAGTAKIYVKGTTGGICDDPRVEDQITETARQFSTVKHVEIWMNGVPLAEAQSAQ